MTSIKLSSIVGIRRLVYGLDPFPVFILKILILIVKIIPFGKYSDEVISKLSKLRYEYLNKVIVRRHLKNGVFNFKGIFLPDISKNSKTLSDLYWVYDDILFVHCFYNDNYNEVFINKLDPLIPEGSYFIKSQELDLTIHPGDVVIDCGAWLGDFSALASFYGAKVHAFEPIPENFLLLENTAKLNGNILPYPFGLGNTKSNNFSFDSTSSGAGSILLDSDFGNIRITTLDDFVKENQIEKIDFIKADIEGMERNMLMGATWVLKNLEPKLSICTYHLADDPVVLTNIIKEANPKYRIIQRRKKLFAWVPVSE